MKQDIKICLVKNGYPPQYTPEVFRDVMEQVENFKENEDVYDNDAKVSSAPMISIPTPIEDEEMAIAAESPEK